MDISCGIEFQFPESNNLTDFVGTSTGISDKLDLGTGQLLDSVSVTTPCTDHDAADKHLSAADFKLDLGPANDFVSSSDFPLENTVSDITSDTLVVNEECSEGYSIVNAALEGGSSLPKHTIPASCALNLGTVTNIQTLQLNSSTLSGMQAVQIIPIENMELLSLVKPVASIQETQQARAPGVILTNSPSAVLLGNVLLLQTLPNPMTHSNILDPGGVNSTVGQNQMLQVLNVQNRLPDQSSISRLPTSYSCMNTNLLNQQKLVLPVPGLVATTNNEGPVTGYNMFSGTQSSNIQPTLVNQSSNTSKDTSSMKGSKITPCENVMSLAKPPVLQQSSESANDQINQDLQKPQTKSDVDSQKNTKILVYGKNIALTFDCRNQNYVMKSIVKAMGQIQSQTLPYTKQSSSLEKPSQDKTVANELKDATKMSATKYVSILSPSPAKIMKQLTNEQDSYPTAVLKPVVIDIKRGPQGGTMCNIDDPIKSDNVAGKCTPKLGQTEAADPTIKPTTSDKVEANTGGKTNSAEDKTTVVSVLCESQGQITHPGKVAPPEHQSAEEKEYKCDLCSAAFNRFGNYTRHRMIHTVNTKDNYRYKCSDCGRLFLQRCDMKRHMLIHTKQEPYKCQECGKGYIRRSDLVVHLRFHKKERAFKCSYCPKEFYQSGDLNRHVRNVHLLSSLLNCGHCNRQFVKEATLIRHMQTKHKDIIIKSLKEKFIKSDSTKDTHQDGKKVERIIEAVTVDTGDTSKSYIQPERNK